ncbi:unnamed protein product [Caenorhabditis auriculariae]|uniref:Uncharacterized protein n=1 Tax=Caenorhabditis auriculariae TaxID=2777116 RepID=A0A8S1HQW7_9PELO|nr:unnamed protein product [Caenorhabditis auriculariae]
MQMIGSAADSKSFNTVSDRSRRVHQFILIKVVGYWPHRWMRLAEAENQVVTPGSKMRKKLKLYLTLQTQNEQAKWAQKVRNPNHVKENGRSPPTECQIAKNRVRGDNNMQKKIGRWRELETVGPAVAV